MNWLDKLCERIDASLHDLEDKVILRLVACHLAETCDESVPGAPMPMLDSNALEASLIWVWPKRQRLLSVTLDCSSSDLTLCLMDKERAANHKQCTKQQVEQATRDFFDGWPT